MGDPICYKSKVLSIAASMSVKFYSQKSFSFFKALLELFFNRIMHAHMLQRLYETCSAQHMQLLPYRLLSTCDIWLVGVSHVICVLLLQKTNFGTTGNNTSNMEFYFTNKHSKSVSLHATSDSSTYCSGGGYTKY